MRKEVDHLASSMNAVHSRAVNSLAAGLPIDQVRTLCQVDTLGLLDNTRHTLSHVESLCKSCKAEFIPELEEIIAIGERTLVLCRPPA
ncbi:hypothetical protein PMAYCL1PPCAC_10528, partial [Pristionchus mayeri]